MNKNRKGRVEKEERVPADTDGGVKVLSEKTGFEENIIDDGMGLESI